MTIKLSVAVRNGMLDAIETAIGASPTLELRTGAPPAATTDADTGTVVASMTLAADFMSNAAAGAKAFSNTPLTDTSAENAGTLGHYRLKAAGGTVHMQGTITATGGGGDMTVDNVVVAAGQQVNITSWSMNMNGHA